MTLINNNLDLIHVFKREGTPENPFVDVNETFTVNHDRVFLKEIPDISHKVIVTEGTNRYNEVVSLSGLSNITDFYVDYNEGIVYFKQALSNKKLRFEYRGKGYVLYPASRIYTNTSTGSNTVQTLQELATAGERVVEGYDERVETIIAKASKKIDEANTEINNSKTQTSYAKAQGDYAKAEGGKLVAYTGEFQTAKSNVEKAIEDSKLATDNADKATKEVNTATVNANDATENANEKARLASDKADLADSKAMLAQASSEVADAKSQLAQEKADLANDKATYANEQGDYAKEQGDYAKQRIY